jgi:hypothetical protein
MKKTLLVLMLTALASVAFAWDSIVLEVTNVPTNASAVATSTNVWGIYEGRGSAQKVFGEIQTVLVDFTGGTNPDVDLDVRTRTTGVSGIQRDIISVDDAVADIEYPLVSYTVEYDNVLATNNYKNMVLYGDEVELLAYDANKTNVNVRVTIVLK